MYSTVVEKAVRLLWRTWLIIGVLAIVFGIVAAVWPHGTIVVITRLCGALTCVGALALTILTGRHVVQNRVWIIPLLFSALMLALGISAFVRPSTFSLALAMIFGVGFIISGIGNMTAGAVPLIGPVRWPIIISGLLQLVCGIVLVFSPFGLLSVTWMIGVVSIVLGAAMVVSGVLIRSRLRSLGEAVGFFDSSVVSTQ